MSESRARARAIVGLLQEVFGHGSKHGLGRHSRKRVNIAETSSLAVLKSRGPTMAPGRPTDGKTFAKANLQVQKPAGLDPRDALDILEVRARGSRSLSAPNTPMSATACWNIWPSMARPPPVRPSPPTLQRRPWSIGFWPTMTSKDVRAELAVKIARLMPGLEQRESEESLRSPSTRWNFWPRIPARQGARHPGGGNQASGLCAARCRAGAWRMIWNSIVAAPILEYSPLLSDTDLMRNHRLRPGAEGADRHRPPKALEREC